MKKLSEFVSFVVLLSGLALAVGGAAPASTNEPAPATVPSRSMLGMGGIVTTPERKATPPFHGTNLPAPPKQNSAWNAPATSLPSNYLSASTTLFEQGLADPRGCEYREIEVGTGSVWRGDGGVVTTHGWVLPETNSGNFAVCWNGVVYPVVNVGSMVDLTADVASLVTNGLGSRMRPTAEGAFISPTSLLGLKGCLLLRLGRSDLAVDCWQALARRSQDFQNGLGLQAPGSGPNPTNTAVSLPDTDPYLDWAGDWAWTLFERMVCAHERGDEMLALLTARQLSEAQPKIETECARRGFPRSPDNSPGMYSPAAGARPHEKEPPYLDFLGQLPQILADLERRHSEGEHDNVAVNGLPKIANQNDRIAALIRDLDLVEARQWSQPGSVNLLDDPVVSALTKEGDPAVERLLDCLENDQRLTRSVGFGRDFFRARRVIRVASAAEVALEDILHAHFEGGAPEIRAYWNLNKGLKLEDRWYEVLKDDSAGVRWLEAAANITQPVNVTASAGGWTMTRPVPTNAPIPMRGEVLRNKANPSVAELLAKRALEVPANDAEHYELSTACQLGFDLMEWDAKAGLPVARTLVKRVNRTLDYSTGSDASRGSQAAFGRNELETRFAALLLACVKTGDPGFIQDYSTWVMTTTPNRDAFNWKDWLEPLRLYRTNEVMRSTAEALFGDTNSPWSRLPWECAWAENPIQTDLVEIPAFRKMVGRELEKTNHYGSITWQAQDTLYFQGTNGGSQGYEASRLEGGPPAVGTTAEIRYCDWIELNWSQKRESPSFNPFAPLQKRNAAIERTKASLRQP
jgi:hypothetical protein